LEAEIKSRNFKSGKRLEKVSVPPPIKGTPERIVICADAREWINDQDNLEAVVTSPPNFEDCTYLNTIEEWKNFFVDTCAEIISKTMTYSIFYVTDRKNGGELIDKSHLLNLACDKTDAYMMWHKIVLRLKPERIDIHRPTYSHLLCYSKKKRPDSSFPDVIHSHSVRYKDEDGLVYRDGMGITATILAVGFIKKYTDAKTIYDPFCGWGTTLEIANRAGLNAHGIEIDPIRRRKARKFEITKMAKITEEEIQKKYEHVDELLNRAQKKK